MSSHHIPDNRPGPQARLVAQMGEGDKTVHVVSHVTALSKAMQPSQVQWLLDYACDRWNANYGSLSNWRAKMTVWQHMSEMDYTDRIGKPDPNNAESIRDVFSYQNDTLGMSEGFVDFATAQARDDIFGTAPWLAATPEGSDDAALADQITKHSNWKLGQSDIEEGTRDAIHVACWGGTAFLKGRWDRQVETFQSFEKVAKSKKAKEPFKDTATGEFVTTEEQAKALGLDGNDVVWADQLVERNSIVYDNTRTTCLDFRDIAFDSKAAQLDLMFTDVFCRFRIGMLDALEAFGIPPEKVPELRNLYVSSGEGARAEKGESDTTSPTPDADGENANPPISMVEGFMRCDPMRTGKPIRVHLVFSPEMRMIFRMDYLANETPGGVLPIFPVRIHKVPGRIFGVGYFEKYETANNAVDRQHNAITYRNRQSANIISAVQPDALLDNSSRDYHLDGSKPYVLAPGKTIKDFVDFATIPDSNDRADQLLNQQLQMAQMRSGITSAAQGELKGVPSASTATGVNQLTSRGALLLKDPIVQLTRDIQAYASFNVDLLYAHHDREETFTWGEGENAELLTISPDDVRGRKMNVTLKLVQAQNQTKLANAQNAIDFLSKYAALPEMEKTTARQLFVQAISSLGFSNAEDMVRQAVTDPAGILALLPPDVAPIVAAALTDAGIMAAEPAPGEEAAAPVTPLTAVA